jgi:hypothetical protein
VWQELEVPVIAAMHGAALGSGCQPAPGADVRIAAPDAQFSVPEIRWGITPDVIGTATLPLLVGLDVAKELTLTSRMISGEETASIELVTKVSDTPLEDARAMAHESAGRSPLAVRGAKKLLNASPHRNVAEQFENERQTIAPLIGSPSRGRLSTTLVFPTAVLETSGTRSGAPRHSAIIYLHDGDRITITASNAAGPPHPAGITTSERIRTSTSPGSRCAQRSWMTRLSRRDCGRSRRTVSSWPSRIDATQPTWGEGFRWCSSPDASQALSDESRYPRSGSMRDASTGVRWRSRHGDSGILDYTAVIHHIVRQTGPRQ